MKGRNDMIVRWSESKGNVHVSIDWRHHDTKPSPRALLSVARGVLEVAQDMISQVTESTDILWREAP